MTKRIISAIIMLMIVIPLIVIGGIPYTLAVGLIGCIAYKEIIDLRHDKLNEYPLLMKCLGLISMLYLIYSNFEKYGLLFGVSYKVLCMIILVICIPIILYKKRYNINDAFHLLADVLFLGILEFAALSDLFAILKLLFRLSKIFRLIWSGILFLSYSFNMKRCKNTLSLLIIALG